MGTYFPVPPGQPAVPWLIAQGAQRVKGVPDHLGGVPAGSVLIAVVDENDFHSAISTDRPPAWLLMGADRAETLTGGRR